MTTMALPQMQAPSEFRVPNRFGRRAAQIVLSFAIALGLIFGLSMTSNAGTASAATGDSVTMSTAAPTLQSVYYGNAVDMDDACRQQYGSGGHLVTAAYNNVSDPYSWFCQRKTGTNSGGSVSYSTDRSASVSADWGDTKEVLGGVAIQPWCDSHYPGTTAKVVDDYAPWWGAYNWRCY